MKISTLSVLIMGGGVTGKAAAEALLPAAGRVAFYDEGKEKAKELKTTFPDVAVYDTVETVPFSEFTLLLKSPGIQPDHPLLLRAEQAGLPVWSDVELAYRLFPERTIAGVTGTNGKTTTTALLCHIAAQEKTVHCLGNIGVGVLPAFFQGSDADLYIIELSSFQLTHSPSLRVSVSGILNLSPDHINWHKSMEAYVAAKARLLLQQEAEDTAVINRDEPLLQEIAQQTRAKILPISLQEPVDGYYKEGEQMMRRGKPFFPFSELQIPGLHNQQNALVAAAMAESLGISDEAIKEGLRTFAGVAHRMEYIGESHGIRFINDSKGTNVDASIKAVEALPYPIRLLAGGMDKKVSYLPLIEKLEGKVEKLYLYGETAALIRDTALEFGFTRIEMFPGLEEAVKKAYADSAPNDQILLSPASASWDMYPNFETRGEHFRSIAKELGVK